MHAIEITDIAKIYGKGKRRIHAVKKINLNIEQGQVYGLLGPNGAGKTTAMRMMLNLIRPTQGNIKIYGQDVRQNHDILRRVGMMIEGASFYPYLTGRKNLILLARTHGLADMKRIDTVLEIVKLSDRADQRFGTYSMGMKQRLGLAGALLHDPDLLILDEPTNGLDPNGILEMRLLLRDLVDNHGKTVCFSSHTLSEVERLCDNLAIIHKGEIVREGNINSLLTEQTQLRIKARPSEKASAVLSPQWHIGKITDDGLFLEATADDAPHIARALVNNGLDIYEITPYRQSLEAFFLDVTSGGEQL
ncbi:MAG: ABC transporter ATP-binding protein [Anaerolineae bacterium]|jgi:ABC-2 type transport system ATP-binding protein|nr:ABC transporter ATP-binding protein [Anaerolineae bacterium]